MNRDFVEMLSALVEAQADFGFQRVAESPGPGVDLGRSSESKRLRPKVSDRNL